MPRSLASAASPFLAGALLGLVAGGVLKIVCDLVLLVGFRHYPAPDERIG